MESSKESFVHIENGNSFETVNNDKNSIEDNQESLPLVDEIRKVSDRVNNFSIEESNLMKNLEYWRNESHKSIEDYYQLKSNEYKKQTSEELDRLKETINSLNIDHDANEDYIEWIEQTIQSIDQQIEQLKNFEGKFLPLKIEHSMMYFPPSISNLKRQPTPLKDLFSFSSSSLNDQPSSSSSSLSPLSPFHFNDINSQISSEFGKESLELSSDSWYSLSSNENSFLLTCKSNLYLIDHSLTILKKKSFVQIGIKDICWSKTLSKFVLISPREIFTVDEKSLTFELCSISLINNNNTWERGTSTETSLYLSTFGENPSIVEFNLLPSIHFNKKYQTNLFCVESETINDIKSYQNFLALIIDNGFSNRTRFQLHYLKSFECIYSIDLGKGWNYRCSPINNNNWIITDSYNQRLIYIKDNQFIEKTETYPTKPFNVVFWGQNQFVIRTDQAINIHRY